MSQKTWRVVRTARPTFHPYRVIETCDDMVPRHVAKCCAEHDAQRIADAFNRAHLPPAERESMDFGGPIVQVPATQELIDALNQAIYSAGFNARQVEALGVLPNTTRMFRGFERELTTLRASLAAAIITAENSKG